jgi:hypothetical protein
VRVLVDAAARRVVGDLLEHVGASATAARPGAHRVRSPACPLARKGEQYEVTGVPADVEVAPDPEVNDSENLAATLARALELLGE